MQYKPTSHQNFSPEEGASQERTGPEPGTLVIEDLTLRHGFIQIPRLLLFARNVSRDAKILYAILLGYAWQEGRCFPGYSKLCEDMQASENMVRKYMRELEEVEIIAQKRRGLGKTNIYTIRDLRTSKIEVQEHNKTEVAEHRKSDVKLETVKKETEELNSSNIRMAKPEEKRARTNETKQSASATRGDSRGDNAGSSFPSPSYSSSLIPQNSRRGDSHGQSSRGDGGFSTIGDSIARSKAGRPPKMYSEDRQIILEYIEDFAREFLDQAPLKSSTSRAYKLYQQSGLPVGAFIARMQQARSVTKESSAQIKSEVREGGTGGGGGTGGSRGNSVYPLKRKMAYFFAVLEDQLGLREGEKAEKKGRDMRARKDSVENEATGEGLDQGEEGHEGKSYRPKYFGSGS